MIYQKNTIHDVHLTFLYTEKLIVFPKISAYDSDFRDSCSFIILRSLVRKKTVYSISYYYIKKNNPALKKNPKSPTESLQTSNACELASYTSLSTSYEFVIISSLKYDFSVEISDAAIKNSSYFEHTTLYENDTQSA